MENQQACELCGKTGLSDDALRDHFAKNHVDGSPKCPFCGVTASSAELLIHVNTQHLDYLTPTSPQNGDTDALNFIDDQTPSSYYSIDSDSMSEYRMSSPDLTNGGKVNGISNANSETGINGSGGSLNGVIRKESSLKNSYVNGFGAAGHSKSYEIQEPVPYSSTNGTKATNGETSTSGMEQGPQVSFFRS